jgi:hypothetical protein
MMDQNEQHLQKIEISIEAAKKSIDLAKALQRLHDNPDFKSVILEDYFHEEAHRAVMLKADPEMALPEKQKAVEDVITGIGGLYNYFGKIYRMAEMSSRAMEADQQTREEILEEQLGEAELMQ